MKKRLSLRTKAEVMLVAFVLIGISAFSVMSVTRTVTDSSDTIDTYIRNSNGKYWEATGANVQLAIDDLTSGGTVWLPGDTVFEVTGDQIVLDDDISLIGAGNSTVIRFIHKDTKGIYASGKTGIEIAHLCIDGNSDVVGDQVTDGTGSGIQLSVCNNIYIHHVTVVDCPSHGIILVNGGNDKIVDTVFLYDNHFRGIHAVTNAGLYGNYSLYNNIIAKYNDFGGIFLGYQGSTNVTLSNSVSVFNGDASGDRGALEINGDDEHDGRILISNCIFGDDACDRVVFILEKAKNIFFSNCFIEAGAGGDKALLLNDVSNIYFSNCMINSYASEEAVYIYGGSNNISFSNCDIKGSGSDFAIYLHTVETVSFSGCTIDGDGYGAIGMWTLVRNCSITDNRIYGFNSRGCIKMYDVLSDYNIIKDNFLFSSHEKIQYSSTNNIIKDNIGYDYDSLQDDYIWNSNGKYYTATETNLQSAIDDLTSGGWVEIPGDTNITITSHLTIGDNIWLRGGGNSSILYLEAAADDNIIENSDQTNGNIGIKITDIKLDGNNVDQTLWDGNAATHAGDKYNCIYFKYVSYSTVENCYMLNPSCSGIVSWEGEKNNYNNNWITGAGIQWEGYHPADWHPCGILCFSDDNTNINGNTIWSILSNGISTEKRVSPGSTNNTINDNIISDCFYGIYIENVNNHTINSNIISDCNKEDAYIPDTHAGGIRLGAGIYPVDDTIVSDNIITSCGNLSSANGFSIYADGSRNQFIGNIVEDSKGYGIYIGSGEGNSVIGGSISYTGKTAGLTVCSLNSIISGVSVEHVTGVGIWLYYAAGDDPADNRGSTISGCTVKYTTGRGMSIYQHRTTVVGNTINETADDGIKLNSANKCKLGFNDIGDSSYVNDGIEVASSYDCIISSNGMSGYLDGIDETGTCDWNIYVGNNARHCTNGFDFNGANNNQTANMGTFI